MRGIGLTPCLGRSQRVVAQVAKSGVTTWKSSDRSPVCRGDTARQHNRYGNEKAPSRVPWLCDLLHDSGERVPVVDEVDKRQVSARGPRAKPARYGQMLRGGPRLVD